VRSGRGEDVGLLVREKPSIELLSKVMPWSSAPRVARPGDVERLVGPSTSVNHSDEANAALLRTVRSIVLSLALHMQPFSHLPVRSHFGPQNSETRRIHARFRSRP